MFRNVRSAKLSASAQWVPLISKQEAWKKITSEADVNVIEKNELLGISSLIYKKIENFSFHSPIHIDTNFLQSIFCFFNK